MICSGKCFRILLLILRYSVIVEEILGDFGKDGGGGCLGVDGGTGTLNLDDHHEFWIGSGSESSVGGNGVTGGTFLVFSFCGNLRGTGFSRDIISFYRSHFRVTDLRSFGEHGNNFFGSLLFDDATQRSGSVVYDGSVGESEAVDDIGLHIDPAVCDDRVGGSHLENRCGNTLSERHSEEFCSGPFLIWIDFPVYLSFQCDIGFLSESEVRDVFVKK